jgi:hypothetical protein
MYHVIMNDPMKTRKVLSCMAITAIIKKKKNILLTFVVISIDSKRPTPSVTAPTLITNLVDRSIENKKCKMYVI